MVNAARKHNRIVQVGTYRRVSPHNISGMNFLKSGKVGKICMSRVFVHYAGGEGERLSEIQPPKGLDCDFWCGLAPYMDFANGQLGDWGIHWMNQVMW